MTDPDHTTILGEPPTSTDADGDDECPECGDPYHERDDFKGPAPVARAVVAHSPNVCLHVDPGPPSQPDDLTIYHHATGIQTFSLDLTSDSTNP